ncbi:MAG: CBS domain-containing protein [Mesorhizobium sp.]|uniref:CBS domain-containing protein n=9 Tax=Mesorhizobium TaxID=68287 RepID=UPI000F7601B2|nr:MULTISPECIES: CBS domain-containing protein [unclassified Mesorhizobium]RUY01001.1 CBS domain-containing protein [Mesorhizobium sp. M2A.F.Ca.ET.040.01.1.1]RVC70228.1 CBS domain-containing protein [Mesorhizobium sp. M00.F.Ca.ET.038.03.1.1]AZO05478.1 CBS domain-containing protein [Mesorhizobium sp. M2A.F.Ca.ET.043.02.1.1]RUW41396.1 CBS domain-containing protein [Mesorhizobium sp. M2A.F.Ca.ET.015.02.1.1]RUW80839.1 CBS domain-containing protein [Mesorhizobium sp. M2A.F.Ca.ET.067.02.1.1]
MQARDIMTTPVVTIATSASVAEAADLMLTRNIRCLPVVGDDGSLAGIISEGDFLRRGELGTRRARPRWLEFLAGPGKLADEYVRSSGRRVAEVMTAGVVSAAPGASLAEVVELMATHDIKNVPVLDADKIVGIVSRSDLMRIMLRTLPKSGSATVDDEVIRRNILAELRGQSWSVGGDLIGVTVDKGDVELSGAIFDERQRKAAVVAAENVAGVKKVTDKLFCAGPFSVVLVS